MTIKKWNSWERITKDELNDPLKLKHKNIKSFSLDDKQRLKSKDIRNDVLLTNKEVPLKNVNEPILCMNCGYNIPNNDYFYLYTPEKKLICRGCRQNIKKCTNCNDVIPPHDYNKDIPFCRDCKKKNICDCCKEEKKIDELNRIPKTKGAYCSNCIKKSKSCLHCFRKIPPNHFICDICAKREKLTKEKIISFIEVVMDFYKKLDPYFSIPIRSRGVSIITLSEIKNNTFLYESPIVIKQSNVYVLDSITEKSIYQYLSYQFSQAYINTWKNIKTDNAMKKILSAFLTYLFFDQKKILILGEDINDVGNIYGRQYSVLKDMKERLGVDEAYKKIKKQFHG